MKVIINIKEKRIRAEKDTKEFFISDNETHNFGIRDLIFEFLNIYSKNFSKIYNFDKNIAFKYSNKIYHAFVYNSKNHLKVLKSLEINKKLWILNYLEFEFILVIFRRHSSNQEQIKSIRYIF